MALQGHIVVPTTHDNAESVVDSLTAKMAMQFGGYSRYDGSGGWNGESQIETEDHVRLVVNNEHMDRKSFREYLEIEAEYVKDALNEEAVLVEIRELEMLLV